MNFSTKDEEKLISIVARHAVIYDKSLPHYRDVVAKENLWIAIAKELNKSSEDCKRKWKTIRDGYMRFKKNKLRTGKAGKNAKDMRHQQLWFLDKSGGSDVPGSPQDPIGYDGNDDTSQGFNEDQESTDQQEPMHDNIKIEKQEESTTSDEETLFEIQASNPKKSRKHSYSDKTTKFWKRRDERVSNTLKSIKDDDVDLFCRHIAEVLRNLPPVYKAEAKKQLSITLSNYEIMAARNSSKDSSVEKYIV